MASSKDSPMVSAGQVWVHVSSGTEVFVQFMDPGGPAFCIIVKEGARGHWDRTNLKVSIPARRFTDLGNRGFRYRSTLRGRRPGSVVASTYGAYNPRANLLGAK